MPPYEKKEPGENLQDQIRSFFGPPDPREKKDALPPKVHFSIWYFLIAFLLFSYLQQTYIRGSEIAEMFGGDGPRSWRNLPPTHPRVR
jgi:hypothetical protein